MGSKSVGPRCENGSGSDVELVVAESPDESGQHGLTYKNFMSFRAYVNYFAELFSLTGYDISVTFGGPNTIETSRASFWINEDARVIRVDLTKVWDIKPTEYAIARVAYHEIVECMLTKIEVYGKRRFCTEDEFEGLIHGIVRTFEGTHFELMWEAGELQDASKKFNNIKAVPGMVGKKALSIMR